MSAKLVQSPEFRAECVECAWRSSITYKSVAQKLARDHNKVCSTTHGKKAHLCTINCEEFAFPSAEG